MLKKNIGISILSLSLVASLGLSMPHKTSAASDLEGVSEATFQISNSDLDSASTLTDSEKKARLDAIMNQAQSVWKENKDMDAVNDFLESKQITIQESNSTDGIITPYSVGDDVTITSPTVAYDNVTGWYTIVGTMQWKKDGSTPRWANDFDYGDSDDDFVGLSLGDGNNSSFTNKGYMLTLYDKYGTSQAYNNAESSGNSGVIWRPEDVFTTNLQTGARNYNIDSYFAALYLQYRGPDKNIGMFNCYGHTYGTSKISGFGFAPYSFSIQFTDAKRGWSITSYPKYFN